jgi:hypothetical protein
MKLKEMLAQKNQKINLEMGKFNVWHSVSYHNHFSGYAEFYTENDKGKKKIVRYYAGEYYRQDLKIAARILIRFFYMILFFGGTVACIWGGSIPAESNRIWYVNLPQALALPCIFWTFLSLLSYLPFVKDIKKGAYRFMVRGVRTGSFISACCLFFSASAASIFVICQGRRNSLELFIPALFLISGLLFLGIHLTERQVTYTIINNETPDLSGGAVLL